MKQTSKLKIVAFKAVLVLLSMILVFCIAEVALRVMYARDQRQGGDLQEKLERSRQTNLGEADDEYNMSGLVQASPVHDIVYCLKPGIEGEFLKKRILTNEHGFRDKSYSKEKPDHCYRIVGLGDSVMFGWGVDQDENYLALLEAQLNDMPGSHPHYEVLNFAVPGYNTSMEIATLEHTALPFEPDLVVLHFVNNDYSAPMFMRTKIDYMTLRASFVMRLLKERWMGFRGLHNINHKPDNLVGARHLRKWDEDQREKVRDEYRHLDGYSAFKRSMKRLATLSQEYEFDVIVLTGTLRGDQPAHLADACALNGFHWAKVNSYTDAYLARHGIPNTKKALRNALWVAPNDHHPNAAGHEIYAEAVMDALAERGVIARRTKGS